MLDQTRARSAPPRAGAGPDLARASDPNKCHITYSIFIVHTRGARRLDSLQIVSQKTFSWVKISCSLSARIINYYFKITELVEAILSHISHVKI